MATRSQGISVQWGGVAFDEVTDLQVTHGGGAAKGRSVIWTDSAGTVSVSCFGTTNISTYQYGVRNDLAISGDGVSLTAKAVYEGVTVTPELNGVTRYSVSFKLLDG